MTEKQLATAALIDVLTRCLATPAGGRQVLVDAADLATASLASAALASLKVNDVSVVENNGAAFVALGKEGGGFSWE